MANVDRYAGPAVTHYDATYTLVRDPSGDAAFYRALAAEAGGPVCELGCGTGRVLLPIALDGVACTGVDASPAMLAALRAKAPPPNLRLVEAAMQTFDLGDDRFALIFAAFRVFQHLYTIDDQLACLARVRRHLARGGRLAFDVFHPRYDLLAGPRPDVEDARFHDGDDEVVRSASFTPDRAAQILHVTMRYERRRSGVLVRDDERETFRMRWFFRWELEHLLARAGFAIEALYGAFDRTPFGSDSPEIIVVARPSD
jgi:SAM-dependent methyltransferase